MPFLEVLTRCHKRPAALAVNRASLATQTDGDWTQTLLVDDVGIGIGKAAERMAEYAPKLVGEFIWTLDDDDMCMAPTLVAELKALTVRYDPDVIMVKMDHGSGRILPADSWELAPVYGGIGASAFIVRRAVWQWHARAMIPGWYGSDFSFIDSIWRADRWKFYWYDRIASKVQSRYRGDEHGRKAIPE